MNLIIVQSNIPVVMVGIAPAPRINQDDVGPVIAKKNNEP